ncbi:MAG TPA: hypothetical protein VKV77_11955 [Methylovirgula sp.]|nr:hypothetical protein [Methylovirgula sp.]
MAFIAGISADDPVADAASETPAIPSTDTALLGPLPLEARFVCDMAEFLLYARTKVRGAGIRSIFPTPGIALGKQASSPALAGRNFT